MERVLKILKRCSFLNQGIIENEIKQYLETGNNSHIFREQERNQYMESYETYPIVALEPIIPHYETG